jgi:hypothetical protein
MAINVFQLVLAAQMPPGMKPNQRPRAKLVLLSLANRCWPDGSQARPSKKTIAQETEIRDDRTVTRYLNKLHELGLIHEQAPPGQHRPRVWRLDLDALQRLRPSKSADAASIDSPSARPDPTDINVPSENPDPSDIGVPSETFGHTDPAFRQSGVQFLETDPSFSRPDPSDINVPRSVFDPSFDPSIEPIAHTNENKDNRRDGNLRGARAIVRPLMAQNLADSEVLRQAREQLLASPDVDHGSDPDDLLQRALSLEVMARTVAKKGSNTARRLRYSRG